MGLLVQLTGALLLCVVGFELWRFVVSSIFKLVVKVGLLTNIAVDTHTKISVMAAAVKMSLWTQLWKFLRAPRRQKLVVLELHSVHLLVAISTAEPTKPLQQREASTVPPFWQTLDMTIALKDIRHPMWSGVRVWIPRLMILFRWIHIAELCVSSISVDVVQKNQEGFVPVLNIQNGSIFVTAMFDAKASDLSFKVTLCRNRPMLFTLPGLAATAALGYSEISVRVPISHTSDDVRAPNPSGYAVMIDLIQVNFDLEHVLQLALRPKLQQRPGDSSDSSETLTGVLEHTGDLVEIGTSQILAVLRLAEVCPTDLRFEIRKLEVNIIDKVSPRRPESTCALGLNGLSVVLSGDSKQELRSMGRLTSEYPVVTRTVDLAFGSLVLHLNEANGENVAPPMVKLDGLKLNAEGALYADATTQSICDEMDENDAKQCSLCFKSTINGGSRGQDVMISERIQPWVASCCEIYDREVSSMQENSPPTKHLVGDQDEVWSAMDCCEIELDAHFKMAKTEVTLISLERTCAVHPIGVPSISFSLGEVSVYCHPFVNEDHLGIRAKADIQCSRLRASYFTSNDLAKRPFLSLDFVRVFVSPVATMMQSEVLAEVEMEAEWVEVKWAPEVLHAIGGVLELGIFSVSSFLHESRYPATENKDSNPESRAKSGLKIPPMRQMAVVSQDIVSPDEVIAFRCTVKRICVTFSYLYDGKQRIDCVTVDTFAVSSEKTTGRLRISILDARAFPSRRKSGEMPSFSAKTSSTQTMFHRKSFTSRASRGRSSAAAASDHGAVFFVADCFSIEENPIDGSTKTVVDLFVNGVRVEWDLSAQLRVMELVRRITFSSWEMIYRARSAYAVHCTPPDSIYNRVGGLNPPLDDLDECLRYERLFSELISASGDKLHRLHATNVSVNAKLCDDVDVHIAVGVFAGDDLPEVWFFENISVKVNELEMVAVGAIRVRHTIGKQKAYVFGEFEDMLRKRLSACKRSTVSLDQSLMDGILIDINALHLRTSRYFPLQAYIDAIQTSFDPFKEKLALAATSYWRPQQALFYQFFLRTPVASHQQEMWLRLDDVGFECLGNSLESWLEQMYPVWIEELAEQELRACMLDDHIASLKLTKSDLHCDASYQEMKTLMTEKNSRMYIQKVKKMKSLAHEVPGGDSGSLISVGVDHVNVDVSFEEDIATAWSSIKELDEATEVLENASKAVGRDLTLFTPSCLLFMGIQVKTIVTDLTVRMRRFPTPLMTCDGLAVGGHVFLTAYSSGCSDLPYNLMAAVRCFVNLSVDVTGPVLYFSPGYLYALNELSELVMAFLPMAVPDIDKHHQTSAEDIVRRLLHGKIAINVKEACVRLFCAPTSFEATEFLEIAVHRVRVGYSSGSIDIDVTRVAVKIEPGSLSHIAELSHLKLQVWLKWGCLSNPAMHYIYPIEFIGAENTIAAGERFVLLIPIPVDSNSTQTGSTNPFQVFQATKLSVFISGKICPVDPERGDSNNADGWSKRNMAARTAVVIYSKNVEWLIGFGRMYQKVPQYPLPRRRGGPKFSLPSTDVLSILEGVTVEEFGLIGLDVALYESEQHPIGVRAFLDDKISCSGALLKGSHEAFADITNVNSDAKDIDGNTNTAVRRLSFILEDVTWVVHGVNVDARAIQVRVCTPQSGSRGESLVTIKYVSLIAGGGTARVPTHDNSLMKPHNPPPMKRVTNSQHFTSPQARNVVEVKERPKQSILEYFAIPHENPFSYRESDSDTDGAIDVNEGGTGENEVTECENEVMNEFRRLGFLLGLLSKDVRVTVTMVVLESLVDIADTWVNVIVTSLPELFSDAAEAAALLEKKEDTTVATDAVEVESGPSPKKFTSLAQDPKFSGILLQGGADSPVHSDSGQFEPTPYSSADTVRPIRRKSSKILSHSERRRSKEEITTLPPATNSKLVQAFIMVKFEDIQISVQDRLHKGSVLLALNSGTLQHAVSPDSSYERIDLNVDGFQAFTAPLDVDVKSHAVWLKTLSDGSYCPSSYGLLKQVIAPIPAQVTVWIDREKSLVKNRVRLDIPTIEVQVNPVSKDILEKLTTTATELVNAKLAEKKSQDRTHVLLGYRRKVQNQGRSLHQLVALKKQLKWKITALEWRQMCGWDYYMNERAMAAVAAAECSRSLPFEIETSPLFRRRRLSSTSLSSLATNIGSTATHRYEDEQFTDELQRMTQQYESLSELTRFMANEIQQQSKPSQASNLDLEFALDHASLMLSGENVDIVQAQVRSLCFKTQLLEDHSGNFALTLEDLTINNLSQGTPYPDLLQSVYSRSWGGDDMFLRVDAEIAKPVRGMTVVQHFEVNVHPIQVCITQEVIMQLVSFFSPSGASTTKEVQRDEVRSQFLQARTGSSSSSDGRVGSAILKAVKVAGKAATHPLSLGRTHRGDIDEDLLSSGRKVQSGARHHIPEDPSQWIAKLVNLSESNELPFGSAVEAELHRADSVEQDAIEMKDKSKNNILFKRIRLGAVEIVLTYKHKKSSVGSSNTPHLHLPHASQPQALEDMRGFEVKTRALVYCDKTCSPMDLLLRIRRDILLDVLSQVGRNFTNIGNFLRDQFDTPRWAAFDALAPLKSLSTTVSSLTSYTGAVVPLAAQQEAPTSTSAPDSDTKAKDTEEILKTSTSPSLRPAELLCDWPRRNSELSTDHYDADTSAPSTPTTAADNGHPKQSKKRTIAKLFSRKKSSSSSPLPSPSTQ